MMATNDNGDIKESAMHHPQLPLVLVALLPYNLWLFVALGFYLAPHSNGGHLPRA